MNLMITFLYDDKLYSIQKTLIHVSMRYIPIASSLLDI